MNPTLRKCLEALSLRQYSQQESSSKKTSVLFQSPADTYSQQNRDDDLSHQSKNLDKEQLLQSKFADTYSQVPIKLDKVDEVSTRGTFQPPFMQEQERISQNSTHIPAPADNPLTNPKLDLVSRIDEDTQQEINTPVVPYVPVKPRECQAFYDMNESMKKYLCNNCDKFGNVKYMSGMIGKCLRFRA